MDRAAFQRCLFLAVRLPESFRGGCSFGADCTDDLRAFGLSHKGSSACSRSESYQARTNRGQRLPALKIKSTGDTLIGEQVRSFAVV
jgi:hypothetical protein